ncbi:MAG: TonB-dependent receptor [Gemmatimonadota bacterium]|nr:TonB-dependent receptor [Gemmatimonadota bacterium]
MNSLRLNSWLIAGVLLPLATATVAESVAGQQAPPQDSLRDSTVVLETIEISVTRRFEDSFGVPYGVSVVRGRDIEKGRATFGLDEALGEVPGLYIANRYNPSLDQRVSIRGFGARAAFGARGVKILLDGVPQTLPDGQGQMTNVEIGSLESVEILRGPSSSLYGNASGGVIALTSKDPSFVEATADFRAVAGAYGFRKAQFSASSPVGSGAIQFSGSGTVLDGYRQHSFARMNTASVKVIQTLDPYTNVRLSSHIAYNPQLDNPGSLNQTELDADPTQANPGNLNAGAGKSVTQAQLGVTVTRESVSGYVLEIAAFGIKRELDNALSYAHITLGRNAYGLRGLIKSPGGDSPVLWQAGFDLQQQRDDRLQETVDRTAVTRSQVERVREIGPFFHVGYDFSSSVQGNAGVRYDRVVFSADDMLLGDGDDSGERSMGQPSVSVGFVIDALPVFKPYINFSTAFETPTTTELVNRPTGGGGFNPDLNPQRALNFEVGARGNVGAKAQYQFAAFSVDVRDALIPFEDSLQPGRQFFRNAGRTRHNGLEMGFRIRPTERILFVTAYTFAGYEFVDFSTDDGVFDGNSIPGVPKHFWYGSVRLNSGRGWWAHADLNASSNFFVDDANTAENDAWFVTNLRIGWDGLLNRWRIEPFVGINNVLNASYVGSVTVNARFGRFFEPAPPRNLYAGFYLGAL